jgi:diguanylate cyclase (GGDEF)-like protein
LHFPTRPYKRLLDFPPADDVVSHQSPGPERFITLPDTHGDGGRAHGLLRRLAYRPLAFREDVGLWFDGLPATGAAIIATGLVLCVTFGDDLTGPDVSFTLLYLGPIAFATWFVSLPFGVFLSAVSALGAFWVDVSSRANPLPAPVQIWNLAVQLGVFLALVVLLAAFKSRLEAEQQLARTDPLTHISNRRAFLEMAALELERARRTGRPITVAYLDCDDFKVINDQFGHAQGDELLLQVATTLRGATRVIDGVARLGGDEFGLLLVDTDGPTAQALVERLRNALSAAMTARGWNVSFSIGASTFVAPPRSLDEMLFHADQLMYDAKRAGKNSAKFEVVERLPSPLGPVGSTTVRAAS